MSKDVISLADTTSFIVDNRGKTVPTSETGIPLIKTNCITNSQLYPRIDRAFYVTQEIYDSWFRAHPIPGDLILTLKGSQNGAVCLVPDPVDFVIAQDMVALRINNEVINPHYLLAALRSREVQHQIKTLDVSGVIPHLKKTDFNKLILPFPSRKTQDQIGNLYYKLSSKIELLRQQNQDLEGLAQTLFKRWFVEFEFPNENDEPYRSSGGKMVESELGEIPEGWKCNELQELVTVKRGGSPRPIQDFLVKEGLPWVKISDATATSSPFLMSTKEFIKEEGLSKTVYLKKGSLILSNSATPGLPKFLELDACIHDGWLYFPKISVITQNYMYLLFLHLKKHIVQQGSGSVFTNLKTDILKEQLLPVATTEIIKSFDSLIDSYFNKIRNNTNEIQTLTHLRDTLLPKLMSGEISVNV